MMWRIKKISVWSWAFFSLLTLIVWPTVALAADPPAGAAKIIDFFRVSGILPALLIVFASIFVIRFLTSFTRRLGERFADKRLLAEQVSTVLRFLTYIAAFILVIRSLFRLDRDMLLALTGTSAVAVGFALKDLAASIVAGITILFDRPFQVGDRVTFGGHYGEIVAIGLRSVRLVTLDDSMVTIPNNKFFVESVVSGNAGALDMQIEMEFFIAQDANLPRAKRIVEEAVRTSRFVYLAKPVVVLVTDLILEDYLVTRLKAKAYVLDVRYEEAFASDVTERVKEGFASGRIKPPTQMRYCPGESSSQSRSA